MNKTVRTAAFAIEILIAAGNFFLIYFLLRHFNLFYHLDLIPGKVVKHPHPLYLYRNAFEAAMAVWMILFWKRGDLEDANVQSYESTLRGALATGALFAVLFTTACFLFKFDFLSRMFLLTYAASTTAWIALARILIVYKTKEAIKNGKEVRNILLAGTGRRAQEFMSHVAKHREWGYRVIGLLDRDPQYKGEVVAGYPVLGVLEDLPEVLEKEVVDEMIFVTPRDWLEEVRKCMLYCEAVGVPATVSTDLFDFEIASGRPKTLEGKTYLTVETRTPRGWELMVKRLLDIAVASAALFVLSPILFLVACAVKITSEGPVFFRQVRSGQYGRRFFLYKFRSMVTNAEDLLAQLREKNEMSGPVFKMTHDPRITPVGRFIRKTSLDEFPQFWNVLKGDMSVVGPRPPLPSEVEKYEPWQRRRLSMKPGITCIWQATHRDGEDFEEWMEIDLRYIDNWSLWLDLKILLLTAKSVITGTGR